MKKSFPVFAVIIVLAMLFVCFSAFAYASDSPEASTYYSVPGPGSPGGVDAASSAFVVTTTGSHPQATYEWNFSRWFSNHDYTGNEGKDDPDSPNYTGDREVTSDKSAVSPDTSAQSSHPAIIAVVITMLTGVAVVAVVSTKSKKTCR